MVTKSVWLVGFEFRSQQGRLVQHFYVVPEATNADDAREAALRRAHTPDERALRGGLGIEAATAETRQVVCDSLGVWSLAARGSCLNEPPAFSAAA